MSQIRLKMLPLSGADFTFTEGKLDEDKEEFKSIMGINQAINRIKKTIIAIGADEGKAEILEGKAKKLSNLAELEIYPIFENTAEALLDAGYTKSQSLNKARKVAFKALKEGLDTLSIIDPDIFPRAVLSTHIKDPQTVQELSKFITQI